MTPNILQTFLLHSDNQLYTNKIHQLYFPLKILIFYNKKYHNNIQKQKSKKHIHEKRVTTQAQNALFALQVNICFFNMFCCCYSFTFICLLLDSVIFVFHVHFGF